MDFVKEYKELYEKTSEHFKDKSREESVWVQFTKSRKLSVKVCKTWFDSQNDTLWKAYVVEIWSGPEGDGGKSDLDTGES